MARALASLLSFWKWKVLGKEFGRETIRYSIFALVLLGRRLLATQPGKQTRKGRIQGLHVHATKKMRLLKNFRSETHWPSGALNRCENQCQKEEKRGPSTPRPGEQKPHVRKSRAAPVGMTIELPETTVLWNSFKSRLPPRRLILRTATRYLAWYNHYMMGDAPPATLSQDTSKLYHANAAVARRLILSQGVKQIFRERASIGCIKVL